MPIKLTESGVELCRKIVRKAFEIDPDRVRKIADALDMDVDEIVRPDRRKVDDFEAEL